MLCGHAVVVTLYLLASLALRSCRLVNRYTYSLPVMVVCIQAFRCSSVLVFSMCSDIVVVFDGYGV
jgi:hypothetical protein